MTTRNRISITTFLVGMLFLFSFVANIENASAGDLYQSSSSRLPNVYRGGSLYSPRSSYKHSLQYNSSRYGTRRYEAVTRHYQSPYRTSNRTTTYPRIYSPNDYSPVTRPRYFETDMYRLPYTRRSNYDHFRPAYRYPISVQVYRPYAGYYPASYMRAYHPYSYYLRPPVSPFSTFVMRSSFGVRVNPFYYGCAPSGFGYRSYGIYRPPAYYGW